VTAVLPALVVDVLRAAYGFRADVAVARPNAHIPLPITLPAVRVRGRKHERHDPRRGNLRCQLLAMEYGTGDEPWVDPWAFCFVSGEVRPEYARPGARVSIRRSCGPRPHTLPDGSTAFVHRWTAHALLG
jgi:hypothetical protein